MVPFLPPTVLQKLAARREWQVRYLVALHEQTPRETRQRLFQDGNCYVRAMARAKETIQKQVLLMQIFHFCMVSFSASKKLAALRYHRTVLFAASE
jgi:hypothetical protein